MVLLVALLVTAVAVNAVQFRAVDAAAGHGRDAIDPGQTADLAVIAYRECGWCRDRYAIHIALHALAPGSSVTVAPSDPYLLPSPYDRAEDAAEEVTVRLLTFGGAARVDWLADDDWAQDPDAPRLVAGIDPAPFVVASGPGGQKGAPWAIAVDPDRRVPGAPDVPRAPGVPGPPGAPGAPGGPDNPDHFLPRALAAGEHRQGPGAHAEPGEFVLVRWYAPRYDHCYATGFCYSYQDLLAETLLLPSHVRKSL